MAPTAIPTIPEPLLAEIFERACAQGSVRERGRLARVCRGARGVVNAGWAEHAETEWGPLDWTGYFKRSHNQPIAEANSSQWGALLATLKAELRPLLRRSIKQAVLYLRSVHLLTGPQPQQEYSWLYNRLRAAADLHDRRRITSYICLTAEDQPYRVLDSLIVRFELRPPNAHMATEEDGWETVLPALSPIASLRHILLQFPFLPIDAGGGADRVIGAIARCYSDAHPEVSEWLGLSPTSTVKDRTDAVHLVVYAAIMLQSDLHNPAVQPKMTVVEFIDSLHRAPVLARMPAERITSIYEDIRSAPLELEEAIDSFVRSNKDGDGDDQVIAPSYSRYSRHSTSGNVQRLYEHCADSCISLQRRADQLRTPQGRRDLRFLAKRWHGQHYATIRLCALFLVVGSLFYGGDSEHGLWAWNVWARTLILAIVFHLGTRA